MLDDILDRILLGYELVFAKLDVRFRWVNELLLTFNYITTF